MGEALAPSLMIVLVQHQLGSRLSLVRECSSPDIESIAGNPRCRLQFLGLDHLRQVEAAGMGLWSNNRLPEYWQKSRPGPVHDTEAKSLCF